jgi:hypothetical protein
MKKISKFKLFIINQRNKKRAPVGTRVIVKECEKFPEGFIGKIISHNTFECEYQITPILESKRSPNNPYILEHEDGLMVTEEEFHAAEFIPYELTEVPVYKAPHPVVIFLTGPIGLFAVGLLLACSGALVTLEFVK